MSKLGEAEWGLEVEGRMMEGRLRQFEPTRGNRIRELSRLQNKKLNRCRGFSLFFEDRMQVLMNSRVPDREEGWGQLEESCSIRTSLADLTGIQVQRPACSLTAPGQIRAAALPSLTRQWKTRGWQAGFHGSLPRLPAATSDTRTIRVRDIQVPLTCWEMLRMRG